MRYPVDDAIPELREKLAAHSAVVLHAPPGAGKTTRVPLALLDLLRPDAGRIVMLEPRRLAAVSAAGWMARLLAEPVGATVGYTIRFDSKTSAKTRVEVVTEGVLTRRIQSDPGLKDIGLVIFDEFHERSIHADLGLGLCCEVKNALRPDLKILVMSATLDCRPVAALLGDAPIVSCEGKLFPVETRYIPAGGDASVSLRAAAAVRRALRDDEGDILVFLPGAAEIRSCTEAVRPLAAPSEVELHPLYADLPFTDQEKAILPSERRKVVIATNIAETSLTIEGVKVVIDSGLTRRLLYDPGSGLNRLVSVPASRASAEQRRGRAGRLGPGVCYRLYRQYDFQTMQEFNPAEIMTADLAPLVLELAVWGVRDPSSLPWLDPPPQAAWNAGLRLLIELGALDQDGRVTKDGREMARFPLHPRLGRLLLRSLDIGAPDVGSDLAALLHERDILGRTPAEQPRDVADRLEILRASRRRGDLPSSADPWAARAVERTAQQLRSMTGGAGRGRAHEEGLQETAARLLIEAYPDRVAQRRPESADRYLLAQGRGVRLPSRSAAMGQEYLVAVNIDLGGKADGLVHLAAPVSLAMIREEADRSIRRVRRVEWAAQEERIVSREEERLGSLVLSARDFLSTDAEAVPVLCEAISRNPAMLGFKPADRRFMARVDLMKATFPDEDWPDLSEAFLASHPGEWLNPWLHGVRTADQVRRLDLMPALKAMLDRNRQRLLDERLPFGIKVPSGREAPLEYRSGETPVLSVKLQEMFGASDTPIIAAGRIRVVVHLLSPAGRPLAVTRDLKNFWNAVYPQVKREMKGRYPKHPWPDDPWTAMPTGRAKKRSG